jgi:dTMP kinase
MIPAGRFVTFEGGEGAGKTTQIGRLAEALRRAHLSVVVTREPGGTPGAEAIRDLLLSGPPDHWLPLTEALLVLAARADHVSRRIQPALAAGDWVLCDRFADSTRVYQGIAGRLGVPLVERLHKAAFGSLRPDLTLILDVPVEVGLTRRRSVAGSNRYEAMDRDFHERVRRGFLALARREPARCVVIDATRDPDAVAAEIRAAVARRFAVDLGDHLLP